MLASKGKENVEHIPVKKVTAIDTTVCKLFLGSYPSRSFAISDAKDGTYSDIHSGQWPIS